MIDRRSKRHGLQSSRRETQPGARALQLSEPMWALPSEQYTGPWRHKGHIERPDTRPIEAQTKRRTISLQNRGHPHTLDWDDPVTQVWTLGYQTPAGFCPHLTTAIARPAERYESSVRRAIAQPAPKCSNQLPALVAAGRKFSSRSPPEIQVCGITTSPCPTIRPGRISDGFILPAS